MKRILHRYGIAAIACAAVMAFSVPFVSAQQSPTTPTPQPEVPGVPEEPAPQTTQSAGSGSAPGTTGQAQQEPIGSAGANVNPRGMRFGDRAGTGGGGAGAPGSEPIPGSPLGTAAGGAGGGPARGTKVVAPAQSLGVRVTSRFESGSNEPYLDREVEYGTVPQDGGEFMTMSSFEEGNAMPLLTFLDELHRATGWNIIPSEELDRIFVRFWIDQMKPQQALEILRAHDLYYAYDQNTNFLYVRTMDEQKRRMFGEITSAEFELRHANILDLETVLKNLASPRGRVIAEPRTSRIFVWDTEDNIVEMRELVERMDRPLEPVTFTLAHANVLDIEESIPEFLSERGVAFTDPRTNTVTITDHADRVRDFSTFLESIDIPLESRTWTLNYANVEDVAGWLEAYVPEEMSPVVVDDVARQVTVTALPSRLDEVGQLISQWDTMRRQVQIEAYLVATNASVMRNFGVNWYYFDEKNGNSIGLTSGEEPLDFLGRRSAGQILQIGAVPYQQTIPSVPLVFPETPVTDVAGEVVPSTAFGNAGLSVALEYLDQQGKLDILTRPRVVVMDGEEAVFENTEDEPFQEAGFFATGASNNNNRNDNLVPLRVQFITVGTILKVKPSISDDDNILMEISAEESTAETVEIVSGDLVSTVPKKRQSRTETQVVVHDEQTIVIAGLRATDLEDEVTKVPVLGDVPLLGRLFKTTRKNHTDQELVIFLTPTIVDEYTQPESARLAKTDDDIAAKLRASKKPMFERWAEKLSGGSNEIGVSIGQSGNIYSEGAFLTLSDLVERFQSIERPSGRTVVIRVHPRAPEELADEIAAQAEQAGLGVERIDEALPFVPVTREEALEP